MTPTQRTFTYTDPRYFDGDPFEVAAKATQQAEEAIELAERAVEDASILARNADLERQLYADPKSVPDAQGWPESPQGKKYEASRWAINNVKLTLRLLAKAVSFNPRHPPAA